MRAPGGRRARWLALGVVVLLVLGAGAWFALGRERARPVTLEEAEERRTTTTGGSTTTAAGEPVRPEAGVYEYRGSGYERLSLPPLSQDQGPTIPATVEHGAKGCWTIRFDYSTNHWQTWEFCRRGEDLVEAGGQTWQRWLIGVTAITNLSTFECDDAPAFPAGWDVGEQGTARCVGTSDTMPGETVSEGPYAFAGEEDLDVGGTAVTTAHFVRERTMTGAQEGTERAEMWFAVDTGMPIRNQRRIEVRTDTPVGASTYTEEGEFRLASLEPVG